MRHLRLFAAAFLLFSTAAQADETLSFLQKFNQERMELEAKYGAAKVSGKGVAVATSAIFCVVQKAGLKQTIAFYEDIKPVAEKAKALCSAKKENDAKNYVLSQYIPRKDDPMVAHTLACYTQYAEKIAAVIPNEKKRAQLPKLYRWAQNPALAYSEMDAQELCH